MSCRLVAIKCTAAGVSFPSLVSATRSLEPLEKNSGAPHSSVSTWADWQQMTAWYDWQSEASTRELAAVPLNAKKTSQSVSNISLKASAAAAVQGSSP